MCSHRSTLVPVLLGMSVVLLAPAPEAQRLVGYDAGGRVFEFPHPIGGPCLGPSDPVYQFPTGGTLGTCTLPGAAAPGLGDIGVDTINDTYWVTDGFALGEYTASGFAISAYNGPFGSLGPLTGLGVDTGNGILWATDGVFFQGFTLPFSASGCFATLTPTGPALPSSSSGVWTTDVEWDPDIGELWFSEWGGYFSLQTNGSPGLAPTGVFGCGIPVTNLQGIAVDRASVATGALNPVIHTTDGLTVAQDEYACCPATNSVKVYDTSTCFPAPGVLNGLSYTVRPNHYGTPSWCIPGSTPSQTTAGQSVVGNTNFAYILENAIPGSFPILYWSTAPFCPQITIVLGGNCPLDLWLNFLFPSIWGSQPMPVTSSAGTSVLPVNINPAWVGTCLYTQMFVVSSQIEATAPMETIFTGP